MNWFLQVFCRLSVLNLSSCEDNGYIYDPDVRVSYKFHSVPMTWLNAKLTCFEEGARLAMPKTNAEAIAMQTIFQDFATSTNNVMFVDSHSMFEADEYVTLDYNLQYFHHTWGTGEPSRIDGECLAMHNNTRLLNYECNGTLQFICQTNDQSEDYGNRVKYPADPRYVYHKDSNKFLKLHMRVRMWAEARAICNAEGGRLAIIESKIQETFMVNMFNDTEYLWPDSINFAFIGFHDYYRSRLFYTVTDKNVRDIGYLNWASGEPNSPNERCGAMNKNGAISDQMCTTRAQFFCERSYIV